MRPQPWLSHHAPPRPDPAPAPGLRQPHRWARWGTSPGRSGSAARIWSTTACPRAGLRRPAAGPAHNPMRPATLAGPLSCNQSRIRQSQAMIK